MPSRPVIGTQIKGVNDEYSVRDYVKPPLVWEIAMLALGQQQTKTLLETPLFLQQ